MRINEATIIDLLASPRRGDNVDPVCLVVEPTDLEALNASGRFDVVAGPSPRWGGRGDGTSLYIRDPDGNTLELRYYTTWTER